MIDTKSADWFQSLYPAVSCRAVMVGAGRSTVKMLVLQYFAALAGATVDSQRRLMSNERSRVEITQSALLHATAS